MDKEKKKNCGIAILWDTTQQEEMDYTLQCGWIAKTWYWMKSPTWSLVPFIHVCNRKNQPTVTESGLVGAWGSGFRVLSTMGHERWGGSQKGTKSVKSHWNWSTSSRCFLILVNDLSPFMSHSLFKVQELANSIKLWAMPCRAIQDRS